MPSNKADPEAAREAAQKKAIETAGTEGLSTPVLVHESGIADIAIIVDTGEVSAVYCRNTDTPPAITVIDLDYEKDPRANDAEAAGRKVHKQLMAGGFETIPHFFEQ
jgi:hypothetical protein